MIKSMTSSLDLYALLEQKYGSNFESNSFKAITGNIQGFINKKKIIIHFKPDECLSISTSPTSKDLLNELLPLLKNVMGNAEPICSYDLQSDGLEEQDSLPTIEWDTVNPDERLKEIINGQAFSENSKIHNLKLYNSKKIEDYLESEQEKEERTKNARIYGIDPGCLKDVATINNLSEVDLYFAIEAMEAHIWRCRHEMKYGRIPQIDLTEEKYALEYMIYQTTKFGVELPNPTLGQHIPITPSYNAWYSFYSNHFKNVLTDEQWIAFRKAQKSGQDTSEFLPSGHWSDLLSSKEKTIKKALN